MKLTPSLCTVTGDGAEPDPLAAVSFEDDKYVVSSSKSPPLLLDSIKSAPGLEVLWLYFLQNFFVHSFACISLSARVSMVNLSTNIIVHEQTRVPILMKEFKYIL